MHIPAFTPHRNCKTTEIDKVEKPSDYETDVDDLRAINTALGTTTKGQGILSIGNGVVLSGKVTVVDKIVIHGSVEAEIDANSVEVMASGILTGTIRTKEFSVSGSFTGDAQVSGNLKIQKGGKIEGDVSYGDLSVENGGLIYGSLSKPAGESCLKPVSAMIRETRKAQVPV